MTISATTFPTPLARRVDPAELVKRLAAASVPARFADCRFETFTRRPGTKAAFEAADALGTAQDGAGLVLVGPPGTGKTHLAVAVVAARIEAWLTAWPDEISERIDLPGADAAGGRPHVSPPPGGWRSRIEVRPNLALRFLVVPSFLDRLRAGMRWQEYDDPLPALFDADLVVLDDLGREKVTDWATERLYVLVNERYNRLRPTVVTSNYTPDQLVERGYEALVSRLTDGAELVRINAADYRRRGR